MNIVQRIINLRCLFIKEHNQKPNILRIGPDLEEELDAALHYMEISPHRVLKHRVFMGMLLKKDTDDGVLQLGIILRGAPEPQNEVWINNLQ